MRTPFRARLFPLCAPSVSIGRHISLLDRKGFTLASQCGKGDIFSLNTAETPHKCSHYQGVMYYVVSILYVSVLQLL